MDVQSKFCDAADWFRPDIERIIRQELQEPPRFHRKQWEFAMIYRALERADKLGENRIGLSMGGGRELIAYAIARRVRQLLITDLYESTTSWECARTDDPDEFIRRNKPFPVDDARLKAMRMDMRDLRFPDATFDFCYSTCAVEHIGTREDFLRHFNEVARVLKDDGLYVFTTEVGFDETVIPDEHNYVFSLQYLYDLFADSNLQPEPVFDARIAPHRVNYPIPSTIHQLMHFGPDNVAQQIMRTAPHIQLLRGRHPFTCGLFLLRKRRRAGSVQPVAFEGLTETRRFAAEGVKEYARMLAASRVSIDPYSFLPGENSRFVADHAEFFSKSGIEGDRETAFHTEYFWFGSGRRVFDVALRVDSSERAGKPTVELRVHRFKTLASNVIDCVSTVTMPVPHVGWMMRRIELETHEDFAYALLAKIRGGTCLFDRIEIKSSPLGLETPMQDSGSSSKRTLVAA